MQAAACTQTHTYTHTHTERERERERRKMYDTNHRVNIDTQTDRNTKHSYQRERAQIITPDKKHT